MSGKGDSYAEAIVLSDMKDDGSSQSKRETSHGHNPISRSALQWISDNRPPDEIEVISLTSTYKLKVPFVAGTVSERKVHPNTNLEKLDKWLFIELANPLNLDKTQTSTKTKGKGPEKLTHICLACLELGCEKHVFSSHSTNRRAHVKSHAHRIIEFKRIKELQGKTLWIYAEGDPDPDEGSGGMFKYMVTSSSRLEDYEIAAVNLMIANGWSLDVFNSELYRDMIIRARSLSEGTKLRIARPTVVKHVKALYAQHWDNFREIVSSSTTRSYSLVIDCWDWGKKLKVIGATAVVLAVKERGLELEKFPLIFRLLEPQGHLDDDTEKYVPIETLQSGQQLAMAIFSILKKNRIPLDKFISARSDGAPNAVKCTEILNSQAKGHIAVKERLEGCVSDMKFCELNCFVHWIALAPKKVLFDSAPEDDDRAGLSLPVMSSSMNVPAGPPSAVAKLLKKMRDVVSKLNDAKTWQKLRDASRSLSFGEPNAIQIDMEVRWFSTMEMLQNLLRMESLLENFVDIDPGLLNIGSCDFDGIREICAILEPLLSVTRFLETSKFPTTSMILPAVFSVLQAYGVDVEQCGIMDPSKISEANLLSLDEIGFQTEHFEKPDKAPKSKLVLVSEMSAIGRNFFMNLRIHLLYRLVGSRTNQNLVEMLACYCDPVGQLFFDKLFGSSASLSKTMKECIQLLSKSRDKMTVAQPKGKQAEQNVVLESLGTLKGGMIFDLDVEEEKPKNTDIVQGELDEFSKDAKKSIMLALTQSSTSRIRIDLTCLIELWMKTLNPLAFWGSRRMRDYPCIFQAASVALGFESHTCLQESVFSSASDTLTNRRKRLVSNPELLEALVVLRYKINLDQRIQKQSKSSYFEELLEQVDEEAQDSGKSSVQEPIDAFFRSKKQKEEETEEDAAAEPKD